MTITVHMPEETERRLTEEAQGMGLSTSDLVIKLIEAHLATPSPASSVSALVQEWMADPDPEEQRDTGDMLIRSLDADRPSDRPLFPADKQGVTW